MSNEEVRSKLYNLHTSNKSIRSKMMKTLKLAKEGDFEKAARLFDESSRELEDVKREHSSMRGELKRHAEEAERTIGFTEALQATIAQANSLQSRQCSAVKFYLYN